MGFIGKGRIITKERVEYCGAAVVWHAVMFFDDSFGCEREVGRSLSAAHAKAIKARWEKETCAVFEPAPVKYSGDGLNGARGKKRRMPKGHDPKAGTRSRMMPCAKKKETDSVTSNGKEQVAP